MNARQRSCNLKNIKKASDCVRHAGIELRTAYYGTPVQSSCLPLPSPIPSTPLCQSGHPEAPERVEGAVAT